MAKQKLCVIHGEFHKFGFQQITPHEQFIQACECGHLTIAPLTRHAKTLLDDAQFTKHSDAQIERIKPDWNVGCGAGTHY